MKNWTIWFKQLFKGGKTKVQPENEESAKFVGKASDIREEKVKGRMLPWLRGLLRSKKIFAKGAQTAKFERSYWDRKRRMVPSSFITPLRACPPKACSDLVYPCIFYDNSNDGSFAWDWTSRYN